MGISIKVFFVEDGDKLRRIPLKYYEALIDDPENTKPLLEYAGQKVRYALVIFTNENRKPSAIKQIQYSFFSFNDEGRMRREEWETQSRLGVESVFGKLYSSIEKSHGSIINANHIFARKRIEHEFKWKPTAEMERAIIDAVFIEKKTVRKTHLRLVEPPNNPDRKN